MGPAWTLSKSCPEVAQDARRVVVNGYGGYVYRVGALTRAAASAFPGVSLARQQRPCRGRIA